MKNYKTVKHAAEAEHTVERSRFIAHIRRVESREQAEQFIAGIKKEYWDARHNVYAYVLKSGESRCSDDGEPSGTSGMPTLDCILKQGFEDVCIVTTRYFGGILLGTGGLVRAYSKAANLALEAAGSTVICECSIYKLIVPYAYIDRLHRFFTELGCVIESTDYAENVTFVFYLQSERVAEFEKKLTDDFHAEIAATFIKNEYREL